MIDNVLQGEAYVKSQCLQRERNLAALIQNLLDHLDFVQDDNSTRRWKKQQTLAIVCFSDDFNVAGADLSQGPTHWFSTDTIVVTDNKITFEPQYTVLKLPDSYWSIFYYTPAGQFAPQRDFHLSINRGDLQRKLILQEFLKNRNIQQDYVNYNANGNTEQPILQRPVSFEQANLESYLNLVVETYAGDATITFSEKTFRALQTPAPWMLFACRNTVKYLRELGFDVLDDVIDHNYDSVFQTGQDGINKIKNWVQAAHHNLERAKSFPELTTRCQQAAEHNRNLLKIWKYQWPDDLAAWLPDLVKVLNKQLQD